MTVAATFVAGTADGWRADPLALLAGYDLRRSVHLPSEALLVRVTVAWSSVVWRAKCRARPCREPGRGTLQSRGAF